jgi:UDP-N-acetyl-L-fucosamine synthase
MKVLTILGTRPEIIRLSRVMARLDSNADIEHVVVHTGQNYDYELNEIFFADLGVRHPDHFLDVSRASVGEAYGDILRKSEEVLISERPDAFLVLGDTNSSIAAVMAKRLHIPIFHMEAGNRSFDTNVPEEVNRRIVDHIADFNLAYSEHARRNLLGEGLEARRVYVTGSPMREVLLHQHEKIEQSQATVDLGLKPREFFLVSAHREENVDIEGRLKMLTDTLRRVYREHGLPIVMSLHPRTRKRLDALGLGEGDGLIFHAPFGFSDYCRLQLDSACVISDSGTITEESAVLGFRAVTIRDSIERPEGLDTGSIILCGLDFDSVNLAVRTRLSDTAQPSPPNDYMVEDFSARVVNLVIGLTGRNSFWSGLHPR